jgi:hypothetical protein
MNMRGVVTLYHQSIILNMTNIGLLKPYNLSALGCRGMSNQSCWGMVSPTKWKMEVRFPRVVTTTLSAKLRAVRSVLRTPINKRTFILILFTYRVRLKR